MLLLGVLSYFVSFLSCINADTEKNLNVPSKDAEGRRRTGSGGDSSPFSQQYHYQSYGGSEMGGGQGGGGEMGGGQGGMQMGGLAFETNTVLLKAMGATLVVLAIFLGKH